MDGLTENIMRVVEQQHSHYTSANQEYWIEFQPEYVGAIQDMEIVGLIETAQEVVMDGKTYAAEDGCIWIRKKVS